MINRNSARLWMLGAALAATAAVAEAANPLFEGWYADPEAIIYDDTYWIYPTYSDAYEKQVFFIGYNLLFANTFSRSFQVFYSDG